MSRFFCFPWTAKTRSTITVLFILYFVLGLESKSESESESIRSLESESEQPHHDSTSLVSSYRVQLRQGVLQNVIGTWSPLALFLAMPLDQVRLD